MRGTPSPCDGVAGRRTRSTAKNACHSQVRCYEMLMSAVSSTAEIRRAESQVQVGPSYQATASLIVRSSPDLLTRPSRAMDSIIGQFCRKNLVASWMLGACTLTLQPCLPPLLVI